MEMHLISFDLPIDAMYWNCQLRIFSDHITYSQFLDPTSVALVKCWWSNGIIIKSIATYARPIE